MTKRHESTVNSNQSTRPLAIRSGYNCCRLVARKGGGCCFEQREG